MSKLLQVQGNRFLDQQGNEIHLRGVNLGGSTKMPPAEPTHLANNFSQHRAVSFVGRPFPLSEAREHFARLRHWGFNFLRFLTTWEAIEHRGRGIYDTDYLDYLTEVVALAGEYGFYVYIDPHQDVWSRMTGGDGAPGWTLEEVGFNIAHLDLSEAAITMQRRYPDYPIMAWTDNYSRLACMTMFTLFFAGDKFAPEFGINGLPIQEHLQGAFLASMGQVVERLKGMPHVLGYGPLNEPGKGFIGMPSLNGFNGFPQHIAELTAFEAMVVGSGFPQIVPQLILTERNWVRSGTVELNPQGISAWHGCDLWRDLGVWGVDAQGQRTILRDDYFADSDFLADGLIPFTQRYADTIRATDPDAIIFVESTPTEAFRFNLDGTALAPMVNASHWYDEQMLFTRQFDGEHARNLATHELVQGREAVQAAFNSNIGLITQASMRMGAVPTVIGEFGLSYDINHSAAYQTGDFSAHELALSMYYTALDAHLAHSAHWNYTADNNNRWGDTWNGEDLSIFSRDQQTDPTNIHSGGRAVRGFSRPTLAQVGGRLLSRHFDYQNVVFTATIEAEAGRESRLYIPDIWFGEGYQLAVSNGTWTPTDDAQWVRWQHDAGGEQTLVLQRSK